MNKFYFKIDGELMVVKIAKFENKNITTINDSIVKKDFIKKIRFKKYDKLVYNQ